MSRFILIVALFGSLLLPGLAGAFPNVIYNPATGSLRFTNDTSKPLAAMYIISESHALTGSPLSIPGAILDSADLPYGLTYLNLPPGDHNVGNVVEPGTPISDLSGFFYLHTLLSRPYPVGTPEPSSALLVTLGGLTLTQLARTRRLRR
jgi:hypothetical protein